MLKKMQRRFVLWTSLAIAAVIALIVLIIHISYRNVMISREDNTLDNIIAGRMDDHHGMMPGGQMPDGMTPPEGEPESFVEGDREGSRNDIYFDGNMSPESPFMTRYFTVSFDTDGNVTGTSIDNIGSVSDEEAREMALELFSGEEARGYTGEYRYRISEQDDGYTAAFLNCSADQQSMSSILFVSLIVGIVSAALLIVVMIIVSGRVIKPYARNAEMQRQFITDAEHELKTPITSISTSADVLLMDGENEWARNIKNQSERMGKLVAGMLKLSRMDEEDPFPDKAEFSVSDAAWETAEPFEKTAKGLGKGFSCDIEDGVRMTGDEPAVQQMMSILLDNAVKYSDDEGNIAFRVYRNRKRVCVDVSNTGDMSHIKEPEKLFDRFYRPDDSRNNRTGGYGIGLSIARAVARSHGGDLNVKIDGNSITFSSVME